MTEVFKAHGLLFEQGGRKGFTTENNSKPDFVFPSFRAYKDENFPNE
ncbi:type II restriction endonuclease, partial [Pseudomonas syringae]